MMKFGRKFAGISLILMAAFFAGAGFASELEVVAQLPVAPGNITVTPSNRIILTLHPFYSPKLKVVELAKDGSLIPFPDADWNRHDPKTTFAWDTVLGIQCDKRGIVWVLDSGSEEGSIPKLVAWDTVRDRMYKVIHLTPPAIVLPTVLPDSVFVNDLAVDRTHDAIYISHSAGAEESAIVVVDLETARVRRVLRAHPSVKPEKVQLRINGRSLDYTLPDSGRFNLLVGVNPIALDSKDEWLYFGPMNGKSMYRIRTADLLNSQFADQQLGQKVERFSDKPICDGLSIDNAGNIYISDLQSSTLSVISPNREFKQLVTDPRISWLESFSYGPDGFLYFVSSQLHLSAPLNEGKNQAKPPFYVLRTKPLAPGVIGR
ncbi:L-dopachrome tautomerase-related protein [Desulfomonile tiedjei]|uniref:Major royal jelly protein n=1 Tax=Desulfomonile tiedjei (strain ATCC 49306 / DSM 6799 / DCB-1) TaxID=706587 RepID=I4CBN3_DESTA|nr:L-dopachrome tautomerase-related protein [Desulfomonile tiedjei]AFM26974.1 Major royal jelly protein [Desulfomonile tiedjei DSM 6799]